MTTYIKCKRCHHEEEEIFNLDIPVTGTILCEWCGVEDHYIVVVEGQLLLDYDTKTIILPNCQDHMTVKQLYDLLQEEFSHIVEVDNTYTAENQPSYTPQDTFDIM